MAREHVAPCEVVNLREIAMETGLKRSVALVKTEAFEAILMHLDSGQVIPAHRVVGPILVHCLSGEVDFSNEGDSHVMHAGDWMHLAGGILHALDAREETVLMVTLLLLPRK
jgi:quercetin dioxygenase-like cupin family protein